MSPFEELKFMQELLKSINITYWLDFGCLLHWYRDKQLSPDDIDFGIFLTDYNKVKDVIEKNKKKFDMIHYRDKEISVKLNGIKFDFICFVQKNDSLYFYAYKQNPECGNKWNWEWRGVFPANVYFPLSTMPIHTLMLPVPNNIERKIELQYGSDWKTPKPHITCWTYELNQVKDVNYRPISVIMTTIARDEILLKILPSYLKYPIKLYLLDQGLHSEIKDQYYNELRLAGHFIEYSPEVGLSAARNYLLSKIESEYILMTEDDIELHTNPYRLLNKFDNINLGILGGLLIRNDKEQHYEYALKLVNGVLSYRTSDCIDLCLNFFLAKKRVFDDILYDNNLKLVEHTDFFLRLQQLHKWKVEYTRNLAGLHHTYKPENYMQLRARAAHYTEEFKKKWNISEIKYENTQSNMFRDDLTVFVITHDNEPNFKKCIDALNEQTLDFKLDIISNYHPMSAALQEMLNRCTTKYFIQVDSDMILQSNAIETLYTAIKQTSQSEAMVCYKLKDIHLDKAIDGIKVYKYDIFKNYPYIDSLGCEMEQLERLQKDNYTYKRVDSVLGEHCPVWTKETIFERYFNYMEKLKKLNSPNYTQLLNTLLRLFLKENNQNNLYAFIGALASCILPDNKLAEKDYTLPLLQKFKLLDSAFERFEFPSVSNTNIAAPELNSNKLLVLQICGIPCANRPFEINRLINTYSTKYRSRHILGAQYSKGNINIPYREFPYDLLLKTDKEQICKLLDEADIIHIHHRVDNSLARILPKNKKIIWTVSNLGSSLSLYPTAQNEKYNQTIKQYTSVITVTDQPQQKEAYKYLTTRTLPLVQCFFDYHVVRKNVRPLVMYAPTNRTMNEFTSKGYFRVIGIIYKLKLEGLEFDFDLIEGISYNENIQRKKLADILIDDVINENFHNSSIEGMCFGSVVLTNFNDGNFPFVKTNIETLETTLKRFILNKSKLEETQQQTLQWRNLNYTPATILRPFETLYDEVLKTEIVTSRLDAISIIHLLKQNNIAFYLTSTSCLEALKYKTISSDSLFLGVESQNIKNAILQLYSQNNLIIEVLPTRTKLIKINDIEVSVPFPVIKYLERVFQKSWSELKDVI